MFNDLNENTYTDAIKFVTQAGIMTGYPDGSFRPNEPVTVAEFCMMIHKLSRDMSIYYDDKEYINNVLPHEKQIIEKFKDKWYLRYLRYIERINVLSNNENLKEEIYRILLNPDENIDVNNSITLLRVFFSIIIPESIHNELNLNYMLDDKSEFNRAKCCVLFYQYIKFWFGNIISNNSRYKIKNILSLWDKSNIDVMMLTANLKCVPQADSLIKDKSFFRLFKYFCSNKIKSMTDVYCKICEIDDLIYCNMEEMSKFKNSIAYQYTSLSSLYKMLSKSNKSNNLRLPNISLHMSNVVYLNDPKEGKLYNDLVKEELCFDENIKNDIKTQNAYILCLSKDDEERLPMWVQYADGAKGCRIKFKIPSDITMYQINYCENKDELPQIIKYLCDKYNEETNEMSKKYIEDKLNEIQYYYKDKYYEHEKEVRYTLNVSPQNAFEYDFIREGEYFPRLYCETPYTFTILSVTLGPKCPNPEQVALYLKRMGVPEILKSEIKFQ